jgi:RNA polymerase sigma-70 factor (ECF subfamily)
MEAHDRVTSQPPRETPDEDLVGRVRNGDQDAFVAMMRRYNQRLYRLARSVLGDDAEAEDVVQQAYLSAYMHMDQFAGAAKFSTWLTKIALHEALARKRRRNRIETVELEPNVRDAIENRSSSPEDEASRAQLRAQIEQAIDALPETYRSVVVMRDVEGLSTADTAACLELSEEAVRVRLHRARAWLREALYARAVTTDVFGFAGERCDRIIAGVMSRLALL